MPGAYLENRRFLSYLLNILEWDGNEIRILNFVLKGCNGPGAATVDRQLFFLQVYSLRVLPSNDCAAYERIPQWTDKRLNAPISGWDRKYIEYYFY